MAPRFIACHLLNEQDCIVGPVYVATAQIIALAPRPIVGTSILAATVRLEVAENVGTILSLIEQAERGDTREG